MSTITSLKINSRRMGQVYTVSRFTEYKIDIDLEMDADGFNIVVGNPDGMYSGIFNKYDDVDVMINDTPVLHGTLDNVRHYWNESESGIQLVGRDMMGIMVSNDALPGTQYNVVPSDYIAQRLNEYGITKHSLDPSASVVDKLIIGTSETEMSIMNNILLESHKRIWSIYDTVYMGDWNTNASPSYKFVRGVSGGIPIQTLEFSDDGTDTKSEVRIYGSMDDGTEKVVGTATNDSMVARGIKRRRVLRSSNDDSSSKYASNALKNVRDGFRDGIALHIQTNTGHGTILPNTTAHVIDTVTKINSVFFIKAVSYTKNIGGGSRTNITMIPGDTTFDVVWNHVGDSKNGSILGTPKMSIDELLASRK